MTEVTKKRAPQVRNTGPKEALAVYRVSDADGNQIVGATVSFDYLGFDAKVALDMLDRAAGAARFVKREIPVAKRAAPKA